ncbi:hypothetical protein [Collinsella aerofaciens]|uniref:hypothetical protein n=1 Tax=Collinsella aerofaciens TaxID=74426 RepID=UPI0022E2F7D8|nr:hypothetical protein [Collinsella aerofaciens]
MRLIGFVDTLTIFVWRKQAPVSVSLETRTASTLTGWASNYPWTSSEGSQYEAFKGKVTNNYSGNSAIAIGSHWWERSVRPSGSANFLFVDGNGDPSGNNYGGATFSDCVRPAFSF